MIEGFASKEAQLMYVRIYCYNVWDRLSNLKHVSLYCCIIMHSSSAAAVPINISLQFTCCHFMHCVITTFQSRSHLPVMPRPSEAVWGVGSSCILRLLKTLVWQLFPEGLVSYPAQSCSPAADGTPKLTENKWWRQVPMTLCPLFPGKPAFFFTVRPDGVSKTGRVGRRCDW